MKNVIAALFSIIAFPGVAIAQQCLGLHDSGQTLSIYPQIERSSHDIGVAVMGRVTPGPVSVAVGTTLPPVKAGASSRRTFRASLAGLHSRVVCPVISLQYTRGEGEGGAKSGLTLSTLDMPIGLGAGAVINPGSEIPIVISVRGGLWYTRARASAGGQEETHDDSSGFASLHIGTGTQGGFVRAGVTTLTRRSTPALFTLAIGASF